MLDKMTVTWSRVLNPILGSPHNANYTNTTGDVTSQNCITNFDAIACARSSVLCVLSAVTAVVCLMRLVRLHLSRGPPCYHRLLLFYTIFLHCFISAVDWVYGWTTQAGLVCAYFSSVELLIICHFYMTLTFRVMHCSGETAIRFSVLALTLLNLYFTFFVVMGMVYATTPWFDCFAPYWLWLSGGYLLTAQLMVGTSIILCRRIDAVSVQSSFKRAQKMDLGFLLFAFENAAILDFAYHLAMFALADNSTGCSGVFHHHQGYYTTVKAPFEFLTYYFPVWISIYVFRFDSRRDDEDNRRLIVSTISDASMLDPSAVPAPNYRNWRRRYRPLGSQQAFRRSLTADLGGTRPTRHRSGGQASSGSRASPSFLKRTRNGAVIQILKRSFSSPTLNNTSSGGLRIVHSVEQRGLAVSSPLDPIPEESVGSASTTGSLHSNEY